MNISMSNYIPGLVSVIVPIYDREQVVGKALRSILAQSYPTVEIIAVNDGSTDGSLSVLEDYVQEYPDKVVIIDQKKNGGQVQARNRGIAKSKGEFIAFLDSDDTWEKEKLSLQMPRFRGNIGLVYSGINEVDTEGRIIRTVLPEPDIRGNIYHHLLVRNRMTGGSVVVTRKALSEVGLFDESFRAAENWDLWIRVSRKFETDFVDQPLVNYMKHTDNMSRDSERIAEASRLILQKHLPILPTDRLLRRCFREAYAYYNYALGVRFFGEGDYDKARKHFCHCWKYVPNYRDTLQRLLRTFLGKRFNSVLSRCRNMA